MPSTLDKTIWQNQSQLGSGVKSPYIVSSNQNVNPYNTPVAGNNFAQDYYNRKLNSGQFNQNLYNQNASSVAQDVAGKSAGNISTDQYGIVKNTQALSPTDLSSQFNNQVSTIRNIGSLATQATEARKQWSDLKQQQDLLNSYNVNPAQYNVTNTGSTGTSGDSSTGGKAVALAMQAYKNGTPYVWGGNSLTKGIDCSGLVQQVYNQLGVNLPRTTYEQAKAGKVINLNSLMPGDLVFYNTNSDPNGIGQYAHVAIYIGNGQTVDARGTRSGMKVGSIYDAGTPVLGVRPW